MFVSETSTARIELTNDGVVVARIRQGVAQSIQDARQNLAGCVLACGGRRRPLLVDIRDAQPLTADVRHFYTGEILVESFEALALLVEASPLGRMMGNVYLRIASAGIPTQLFADEHRARAWLKPYTRGGSA